MGFMKNFLSSLGTKSLDVREVSNVVRKACEIIRPELGSNYTDKKAMSKYRGWVYVSATHNAKNVADAEIRLYSNVAPRVATGKRVDSLSLKQLQSYQLKAHKDTVEIENHPVIDLLHNPNPSDTLYSLLYKTELFLELAGDAYWYVERNQNGLPINLWCLYSQFVDIQHDGSNKIIRYNYGVARDGKWQYQFEPQDIIHFKFFDPNDLFHGISPLHAAARSNGLIESMDTYEEALNRNLGIPSGVLKYVSQSIKPDQRSIIEKKWQQKFSSVGRSGKVVVTDQDVAYEAIGVTPRDMNFLDGRKWSREEILACYGINPALLLTDDVNRSNMETASINYHHNTLKPRLKMISQTITNRLVKPNGINGSDLFVILEKDAPQDRDFLIEKVKILSDARAIKVNELRKELGMPMLEDEAGEAIVESRNTNNTQEKNSTTIISEK